MEKTERQKLAEEGRERLRDVADNGTDDDVLATASNIHLGMIIGQMIDSLTVAGDRMEHDGFSRSSYQPMAINQIRHRISGLNYQINIHEVDEATVSDFAEAMTNAKPLDDEITRH